MPRKVPYPKQPYPNSPSNNDDTKDDIPDNVTHVKVDPSVKEIHNKVEFSEGLEVIGKGAFSIATTLKLINKLPLTLQEIGDCAFCRCQSLDSIEIPEGLQVIGRSAFGQCGELKRIKILR
jgi:hypothetical protein